MAFVLVLSAFVLEVGEVFIDTFFSIFISKCPKPTCRKNKMGYQQLILLDQEAKAAKIERQPVQTLTTTAKRDLNPFELKSVDVML